MHMRVNRKQPLSKAATEMCFLGGLQIFDCILKNTFVSKIANLKPKASQLSQLTPFTNIFHRILIKTVVATSFDSRCEGNSRVKKLLCFILLMLYPHSGHIIP